MQKSNPFLMHSSGRVGVPKNNLGLVSPIETPKQTLKNWTEMMVPDTSSFITSWYPLVN